MATQETLPKKYIKFAKTQLGEDPQNNPAHIQALRRWLSSMPHLKCPDDDDFLLMFLRQAKFSQAKAQARIDNFCTLSSTKTVGNVIWSTPIDLKSPDLSRYLKMGVHVRVGYTEDGTLVMWMRMGCWNPDELSFDKIFYYAYKMIFMLASDPRTLIGGMINILDFTNVTSRQTIKDPNTIRNMVRFFQEALPGRIKRIIYYNEGKLLDTMIGIFIYYMKEKMRNRLLRVGPNITEAFKLEPALQAILPPELGGTGKPEAQLIESTKERFLAFYGNGDKTAEIKVDESKRTSSAKKYLTEYKEYNLANMGSSGTYVRINDGEI